MALFSVNTEKQKWTTNNSQRNAGNTRGFNLTKKHRKYKSIGKSAGTVASHSVVTKLRADNNSQHFLSST